MHNKNTMWNPVTKSPGGLRKPLQGKYTQIPKLRKEIEKAKIEEEKEYWMELIGRIPKLDHLK